MKYCAKQKIKFKFPCKFVAFSLSRRSKKKITQHLHGSASSADYLPFADCYVLLFAQKCVWLLSELKTNTEIVVPNTHSVRFIFIFYESFGCDSTKSNHSSIAESFSTDNENSLLPHHRTHTHTHRADKQYMINRR